MRIFDNFFLDLDNFFYIINKEKEPTKMNETVEQTYPARKVLNLKIYWRGERLRTFRVNGQFKND